jgi:hypothetical protein
MYRESTRYARSALMDVEVVWKFMVREAEEMAPPKESDINQENFHFLSLLDKAHSRM